MSTKKKWTKERVMDHAVHPHRMGWAVMDEDGVLVTVMDSEEWAEYIVQCVNSRNKLEKENKWLKELLDKYESD